MLATILITDIVASSRAVSELGDERWIRLLETFESCARDEIRRARGKLVKTMGDGLLATFSGPARAIRCATRLRERVRDLGLEIRSGIHTGEVEFRHDDVVGIAVHITARVTDMAGAGEVLVSGSVPPLVAGAGVTFGDRGLHELRGIEGKWQVLEVSDS